MPPADAASDPGFNVRPARGAQDAARLAALLCALEGAPDAQAVARIEAAAARLCDADDAARQPFALLAVQRDGEVLGCATLSPFFPAPDGHWGLYLEELFVAPQGRRRGVATGLLRAAAALALRQGYARLFWTTTTDNAPALALYRRVLGPPSGKVHFQADHAALTALAVGLQEP